MEWKTTPGLTNYPDALAAMAQRVAAIQAGEAEELVWLVEHPPLYTLGTSGKSSDILGRGAFPTYETGRGGQVTYHGPGQRVVYLMLDLKKRAAAKGQAPDLRAYVADLERWIIATLDAFGIEGFVREGRVGVWVEQGSAVRGQRSGKEECEPKGVVPLPLGERLGEGTATRDSPTLMAPSPNPLPQAGEGFAASLPVQIPSHVSPVTIHHSPLTTHEAKIAALGVRVQKWVTSHGIALNVNPDLSHYAGIVPCGIREFGVTSMHQLGVTVGMAEVDGVLKERWERVFSA
jgi:lipoyl(octanoyl) transferase